MAHCVEDNMWWKNLTDDQKKYFDMMNFTTANNITEYFGENEPKLVPNYNLAENDKEYRSYPLDEKRVVTWVNRIEKETKFDRPFIGTFARFVGANIQHISFEKFLEKLNEVTDEVCSFISKEKQKAVQYKTDVNVIVVLDGSWDKSNTWAFLLMWPKLKEYVKYFCSNPKEAIELHEYLNEKNKGSKTIIIHPDDCAYSGTQFLKSVKNPLTNLFLKYQRAGKVLSDHVTYMITIPFISNVARYYIGLAQLFKDHTKNVSSEPSTVKGCIVIPESSVKMDSLARQMLDRVNNPIIVTKQKQNGVKDTNISQAEYYSIMKYFNGELDGTKNDDYKKAFEYRASSVVHIVYFDHKLADGLSIINKILAISPILINASDSWALLGLISNCKPNLYSTIETDENGKPRKDKDGNPLSVNVSKDPEISLYDTDFTKLGVCPQPYYKIQNYTFRGQELSPLIAFAKEQNFNENGFFDFMLQIEKFAKEFNESKLLKQKAITRSRTKSDSNKVKPTQSRVVACINCGDNARFICGGCTKIQTVYCGKACQIRDYYHECV